MSSAPTTPQTTRPPSMARTTRPLAATGMWQVPAPAPIPVVPQVPDTIEDAPRHTKSGAQKALIGFGILGLVVTGVTVGTVLGVRAHKHVPTPSGPTPTATPVAQNPIASTPVSSGPGFNNTGISMVQAYNKAFSTNYDNSQTGFASLKQATQGDFSTAQLFAQYACSGTVANMSCSLTQALQGNNQQVNLPLVIVDEDVRQSSVSVTARCDTGSITTPQTFTAPLPPVAKGNTTRGFFSLLNSPDAACATTSGAPMYNFHYNMTAGNQTVGANNSIVLFKRNAAGQITNALIGVNQGDRTDPMFFNEPIYNLQTSY